LVWQLVAVAGLVQLPELAAMRLHHPQLNIIMVRCKALQDKQRNISSSKVWCYAFEQWQHSLGNAVFAEQQQLPQLMCCSDEYPCSSYCHPAENAN
jgi:hypothetical protein